MSEKVVKDLGEQTLTKTRSAPDREVAAMSKIARVLSELDEAERHAVLAWAQRKYGMPVAVQAPPLETMRFK